MLPYRDSRIISIAIIIFFVLVVGYGYFEIQGLLFGPHIDLSGAPQEVHDQFITIKGKAERISSLKMQGQPIDVTENGEFSEPYLLQPGLNRIVLEASDKYGHTSRQVLQIVYTPATTTPTTVSATSTATSTESVAQ